MTDLTATTKRIMELFNYFKLKAGETLYLKLFLTRKLLWRDLEEQEVQDALGELIQLGYITAIEDPSGWRLSDSGFQYLKSLKR